MTNESPGRDQSTSVAAGEHDPGPLPVVVEPETAEVSTIPVTPRTRLEVTRRGGHTRLALVSVTAGARVATDLPPQAVDALVWALVRHTTAPYLLAAPLVGEVSR